MKLFFSPLLLKLACIGLLLMIIVSCKKSDSAPPPTAPAVTTTALTNITTSSATTGGTILTDGNAAITQSGIVWSKTNVTPTLTDSVLAGTTSKGSFTTNLTGLDFNTIYYLRAYATNSVGTGYGEVVKLNTTNDTSKVRFTYNGKEVVYGIIISSVTGKKWLDRNIGAIQVATAFDDYKAYGDLFQWGRPADGHQLMNWTASITGVPVNGITNVLATTDNPGHNNFIDATSTLNPSTGAGSFDWRSDNNRSRWATNPQGPCPAGWHVPTIAEWRAEAAKPNGTANSGGMTDRNTAFSQLKLTVAGVRRDDLAGKLTNMGDRGYYWSTTDQVNLDGFSDVSNFEIWSGFVQRNNYNKSAAMCVRCLIN